MMTLSIFHFVHYKNRCENECQKGREMFTSTVMVKITCTFAHFLGIWQGRESAMDYLDVEVWRGI